MVGRFSSELRFPPSHSTRPAFCFHRMRAASPEGKNDNAWRTSEHIRSGISSIPYPAISSGGTCGRCYASLADMDEEPNGNVKFTRNGRTVTRGPAIRCAGADAHPAFPGAIGSTSQDAVADGIHLLVVIDHRKARIYAAELHGSVPQRITPYDPHGFGRNLHYVQDDSNGQRKPEIKSFYEAVVRTLEGAQKILVFGSGTGAGSDMEQLLAELKQHHAELSRHRWRRRDRRAAPEPRTSCWPRPESSTAGRCRSLKSFTNKTTYACCNQSS